MYTYFPHTHICAIIIIKEKGTINLSWGEDMDMGGAERNYLERVAGTKYVIDVIIFQLKHILLKERNNSILLGFRKLIRTQSMYFF